VRTSTKSKSLNIVSTRDNVKSVFSLANLKKHAIKFEPKSQLATCFADFLVAKPTFNSSNNHKNFLNSIMRQMERSSKFTLRYMDARSNDWQSFEKSYSRVFNSESS
jgi:hypothetical protein